MEAPHTWGMVSPCTRNLRLHKGGYTMKKKKVNRDKGLHEQITFMITEEDREFLRQIEEDTGANVSAIMRKALKLYRETKEDK